MGLFIRWMFSLITVSAHCANAKLFGFQGQHKPHALQPGGVLQKMSWPDPRLEEDQAQMGRPATTPQPAFTTPRQPVFALVKPQLPPGYPVYKPWRVPTYTHTHLGHAQKPSQLPSSPHGQLVPYWVQVPSYYLNVHKEKPHGWGPTASPPTKMPNYPVRHFQHVTRYPMQHPTQLPRYAPNVFPQFHIPTVVPKQEVPDVSRYTPAQGGQLEQPKPPLPLMELEAQGYPPSVQPGVPNVPRYPIRLPEKFQYQGVKGPQGVKGSQVPYLPRDHYEQMFDYPKLPHLVPHSFVPGLPRYLVHPLHPSRRRNYLVKGPPVLQQLQQPRFEWSPQHGQWVPKFSPRQ